MLFGLVRILTNWVLQCAVHSFILKIRFIENHRQTNKDVIWKHKANCFKFWRVLAALNRYLRVMCNTKWKSILFSNSVEKKRTKKMTHQYTICILHIHKRIQQQQQLMAHRNNNALNSDQHLSSVIVMRVDHTDDYIIYICYLVAWLYNLLLLLLLLPFSWDFFLSLFTENITNSNCNVLAKPKKKRRSKNMRKVAYGTKEEKENNLSICETVYQPPTNNK